jgi:hypothetical protein
MSFSGSLNVGRRALAAGRSTENEQVPCHALAPLGAHNRSDRRQMMRTTQTINARAHARFGDRASHA